MHTIEFFQFHIDYTNAYVRGIKMRITFFPQLPIIT